MCEIFSKNFKNSQAKWQVHTHRRDTNNIINKIKKTADLLYEKQIGKAGTAGTDPYSLNLAISDDTQSLDREFPTHSNIPQTIPNVNGKNLKSK
ncbi:hypothetical protein [Treponema sp. R80B11-R83G3]